MSTPAQQCPAPLDGADLIDWSLDLGLGGTCLGCTRPGRLLCGDCAMALRTEPFVPQLVPMPAGLHNPWAAGDYADTLRRVIVGHKEEGWASLSPVLGGRLAHAIAAVASAHRSRVLGADLPLILVPVPSRRASVRARGRDPMLSLVHDAARVLRHDWPWVGVSRLLHVDRAVADQAGLDARARHDNLHGSMRVRASALRRLAKASTQACVVVCDDVITTGATAVEAQRSLRAVGLHPSGIAAVAATRKRVISPSQVSRGSEKATEDKNSG